MLGREVTARVHNLRQVNWRSLGINFVMVFSPNTLQAAPHSHIVTVEMQGGDEAKLLNAMARAYPSVTAVRVKDAIAVISDLLSKMLAAIRGANVLTLLTGVLVLAGALAAGLSGRIYDAVVLKTYGASRRQLMGAFVIEYAGLGLASALFGIAVGSLGLVVSRPLHSGNAVELLGYDRGGNRAHRHGDHRAGGPDGHLAGALGAGLRRCSETSRIARRVRVRHGAMVVLNRIYTRTGDAGETALGTGERVSKAHLRIHAYGTVDETNAVVGIARLHMAAVEFSRLDAMLARIQNELFDLGADLCMPDDGNKPGYEPLRIAPTQFERIEREIDELNGELAPLRSFVLPGGHPAAAHLHLARTVCRRAERLIVELKLQAGEHVSEGAIAYINRLSDFFFVASRWANARV